MDDKRTETAESSDDQSQWHTIFRALFHLPITAASQTNFLSIKTMCCFCHNYYQLIVLTNVEKKENDGETKRNSILRNNYILRP